MLDEQETLAHPEQPRFLLSTWFWAVALFVCFGLLVVIAFAAMSRGSTYESTRAKARMEKLKTAREAWDKTAVSYGWVDKGKDVAHIPVTRAMQLELADLQKEKPHAAGPIATPEPAVTSTPVPVNATGAAQPTAPPASAPSGQKENLEQNRSTQPAAAVQAPNAPPNTQPGPSATPAARPNSVTELPPVTPSVTPVQHPPGTPLPIRGKRPGPATSPSPSRH